MKLTTYNDLFGQLSTCPRQYRPRAAEAALRVLQSAGLRSPDLVHFDKMHNCMQLSWTNILCALNPLVGHPDAEVLVIKCMDDGAYQVIGWNGKSDAMTSHHTLDDIDEMVAAGRLSVPAVDGCSEVFGDAEVFSGSHGISTIREFKQGLEKRGVDTTQGVFVASYAWVREGVVSAIVGGDIAADKPLPSTTLICNRICLLRNDVPPGVVAFAKGTTYDVTSNNGIKYPSGDIAGDGFTVTSGTLVIDKDSEDNVKATRVLESSNVKYLVCDGYSGPAILVK